MPQTNPLLTKWDTPFEIPPFAEVKPEHYQPAFDAAMEAHDAEIEAIAGNADAPDFANTIEALELSGEALDKVAAVFFNLSGSNTNPELQEIEREMAPKLAAHHSRLMLNADLFDRVDALYEKRDTLGLTGEQMRVLERYHSGFVRPGQNQARDGGAHPRHHRCLSRCDSAEPLRLGSRNRQCDLLSVLRSGQLHYRAGAIRRWRI